ncbi:ABC transporter permease [Paenibacillus piri]|uniref:Sugar ABC transporter permease n=1 Tax=Paenibacillus piri TaxID=2547395 RepID=A0A4R5KTF3_9BACL|nr:ABC transporter permease subunit [Paenibacillus piri]TDF98712.1 sugar ABC transporter permease [Paenibacillus piri]
MDSIPYQTEAEAVKPKRRTLFSYLWDARLLYLLLLPGLIHMVLFKYLPLFGILIAFQDYSPFKGVLSSPWVGLKHFIAFFSDSYSLVLIKNTVLLAFYNLLFGFPIPIIFALFLNEVRNKLVKRFAQSFSFFPYFISSAVTVGIAYTFLSPQGGLINELLQLSGLESVFFMAEPGWFRTIYVGLNIWHSFGYGAIIYLAAITGIDPHLYEAAEMDGANRWQKMGYVTLPAISNIIVVMFIINIGNILSVDLDKILLMYNPSVYETADVIQSYVYRVGFASKGFTNYSLGAAIGIFQSVVALLMIYGANQAAKKYSETRLF